MSSFEQKLRKLAVSRGTDLLTIFKNVSFQAGNEVINNTPVDQGTAKGSWVFVKNNVPTHVPDRTAEQAIAELRRVTNSLALGDTFYVVSNLEYMPVLEYGLFVGQGSKITGAGFSTQAPAGMVRIAADKIQSAVDEEVRNVR